MCIAVPAKIIKIDKEMAEVNYNGIVLKTNIYFIDNPNIGDYVLIHAGCAIEKLNEDEAKETLKIFEELSEIIDRGN